MNEGGEITVSLPRRKKRRNEFWFIVLVLVVIPALIGSDVALVRNEGANVQRKGGKEVEREGIRRFHTRACQP